VPHDLNNDGNWIQTYSGRPLFPGNPTSDSITLGDIAHALSLTNRFGGHTTHALSVAQHCVNCFRVAPKCYKLESLLHDATEAYLGDLPSPIKALCPDYKALEDRLYGVIAHLFNFAAKMSPVVHTVDLRMLVTEAAHLFANDNRYRWWTDEHWPEPYHVTNNDHGVDLSYWTPERAEYAFLSAFHSLR